jgi:hypothetical protein
MITLDQHINYVTTEYAKKIGRYTVQLYEFIDTPKKFKPKFQPIASSILLTHNKRYFLITAGHVLSDYDKGKIGIFEKRTFYRLINAGQDIFFINPENGPAQKNFDIAVWELDKDTVQILSRFYDFLTPDKVLLEHNYSSSVEYLIVGFPWRRTKYNPIKRVLRPKIYKILTKTVSNTTYTRLKLIPDINFVVEYAQSKIKDMNTGSLGQSILLEGISGCGVWYIPKFITEYKKTDNFYLVGVVFRHDVNKKYIISLKSKRIVQILKEKFDLH